MWFVAVVALSLRREAGGGGEIQLVNDRQDWFGYCWQLPIPAGECVDVIVLSDARPIYLPIHILIPVKEDLTAEQTETCQWKRIA